MVSTLTKNHQQVNMQLMFLYYQRGVILVFLQLSLISGHLGLLINNYDGESFVGSH